MKLDAPIINKANVIRPLPKNSIIDYKGIHAKVVEDDGGDKIKVESGGVIQEWYWKFEGIECTLIQSADQEIDNKVSEIINGIRAQREKVLEAFIAETGLLPSECEQITQGNRWWVQKRKK